MGSGMASSILPPEICGRPRYTARRAVFGLNRGAFQAPRDSSPELRALYSMFALESMAKPHGQLVPVSSTPYSVSTPGLSTSSSTRGLQEPYGSGFLLWRSASRLYAFSGYLFRAWLPGYARGLTTGTPEARPPRSSRTMGRSSQVSCAHGR